MQVNYLYPGDAVAPIEVGDGYRDYRLSEVLAHSGHEIKEIESEPFCATGHNTLYDIILVHLSGGKCILLAPVNTYIGNSPLCCYPEDILKKTLIISEEYTDLAIRYFFQENVIKRPVWVSTEVIRKFKNPEEKGPVLSTVNILSGDISIPYCSDIIEGDLIEPDLVIRDDIVKRLMRSPYIDNAE